MLAPFQALAPFLPQASDPHHSLQQCLHTGSIQRKACSSTRCPQYYTTFSLCSHFSLPKVTPSGLNRAQSPIKWLLVHPLAWRYSSTRGTTSLSFQGEAFSTPSPGSPAGIVLDPKSLKAAGKQIFSRSRAKLLPHHASSRSQKHGSDTLTLHHRQVKSTLRRAFFPSLHFVLKGLRISFMNAPNCGSCWVIFKSTELDFQDCEWGNAKLLLSNNSPDNGHNFPRVWTPKLTISFIPLQNPLHWLRGFALYDPGSS